MNDYSKISEFLEAERKEGAFVFMPSPILPMADSFYMPVVETVHLREDEIYKAQGKYRIHYNGLLRLSIAAAFEWSAIDTCRTDGRTDKLYCSFRAVGGVKKADGKIYFHKAEKDIDLEVIGMELEDQYSAGWDKGNKNKWPFKDYKSKDVYVAAMTRRDLIQKRKNKLMLVESGAKARVIRFVLGLQSQYSDENQLIGTPFIMVHYALNPNHKDVKAALVQGIPEANAMIYGGVKDTGQIPMISGIDKHDSEIIDVTESSNDEGGNEPSGFSPDTNAVADTNLVDFQNIEIDEQVKTLKTMCKKCGQDFDFYEKQSKVGIKNADQQWRDDFFVWLKEEMGDK